MRFVLALALTLLACPAFAQTPFDTLKQLRTEYPTPMAPSQLGEMLNRVAWAHRAEGFGLLRKDGGSRCPHPAGVFISCDILVSTVTGNHYDVLIDQDATAEPTWRDVGPCVLGPSSGCEMSRFLAPTQPSGPVTPPPPPPPPITELAVLLAIVDALSARLEAAIAAGQAGAQELIDAARLTNTRIDALSAIVGELQAQPRSTRCTASVFGIRVACRLE